MTGNPGRSRLVSGRWRRTLLFLLAASFAFYTLGLFLTGFNYITWLDLLLLAIFGVALWGRSSTWLRVTVAMSGSGLVLAGVLLSGASTPFGAESLVDMLLSRPINPWWCYVVGGGVLVIAMLPARRSRGASS